MGNARTALVAWLSVRSRGGSFLWRLEDLDGPRTVAGMAAAALEDLRWLGLDWDEGPEAGGPCGPYEQSKRSALYEAALAHLAATGRLFPCRLSRKELRQLQDIATAPHGSDGQPPYPSHLRPRDLPADWYPSFQELAAPDAALRFAIHDRPVTFEDRLLGPQTERVDETVGDFVLKRRDGLYAYQLAVVVDDVAMGVDDVVRGADLLESTARQIQLLEALGAPPPAYAHVPLVLNAQGEKISKRDGGLTLAALREAGIQPEALVGAFAHSLGLAESPAPCRAAELIPRFAWHRLHATPWRLPDDWMGDLERS